MIASLRNEVRLYEIKNPRKSVDLFCDGHEIQLNPMRQQSLIRR